MFTIECSFIENLFGLALLPRRCDAEVSLCLVKLFDCRPTPAINKGTALPAVEHDRRLSRSSPVEYIMRAIIWLIHKLVFNPHTFAMTTLQTRVLGNKSVGSDLAETSASLGAAGILLVWQSRYPCS